MTMLTTTIAHQTLAAELSAGGLTWLETIQSGGVVGYIILGMSVVAVALIIMHFVQIRRAALMPPVHLEAVETMLSRGEIGPALEYCLDPVNDSYLTRILGAGLTRYQKSAFGAFEIKNAIEEAGEDQTARLYRSTDALGVVGAIPPLLGLLGTVLGMVGAFEAISHSAGGISGGHEALASNISLALVTTLMGLTLAIPCIALFTFFRNRIDAFASEAALEIERVALHLESPMPTPAPVTSAAGGGKAP
jgi:biopolymer transport protein ExbB